MVLPWYPLRVMLVALVIGTCPVVAQTERVLVRPAIPVLHPERAFLMTVALAGNRLVAGGGHGVVIYSDDDGRSWQQSSVPVQVSITSIRFATPQIGWAVGHFGVILRTDDGGATWSKQLDGNQAAALAVQHATALPAQEMTKASRLVADGPDKPFFLINVLDASHVLVFGAFNLALETRDGGNTWGWWGDQIESAGGYHGYGIVAKGDFILMVGEAGLMQRGTVSCRCLKSLKSPYDGSLFGAVHNGAAGIVAFGLRGSVFVTKSQGDTWTEIANPVAVTVTSAVRLGDGRLILGNMHGDMLQFLPNKEELVPLGINAEMPLLEMIETPQASLIAVGPAGLKRFDAKELVR